MSDLAVMLGPVAALLGVVLGGLLTSRSQIHLPRVRGAGRRGHRRGLGDVSMIDPYRGETPGPGEAGFAQFREILTGLGGLRGEDQADGVVPNLVCWV
jgi:hypothetical protein